MEEFVYLYRRPTLPATGSAQMMQETMERWQAWFRDLEEKGHLANYGQPLEPVQGRVVKDEKGSFSDGVYAETKDIVVGYSIIRAKNFDEAVALTNGSPIFAQGGMIEIRPILKL